MPFARKAHALAAPALALTMLLPTLATPIARASTGATVLDPTVKIHPMLQAGGQLDPTSLVRVIVQKTKADVKADSLLKLVPDAQLAEEFKVIPGFVATLPQGEVSLLALNPDVRYVSPDGSVDVIPGKKAKDSKAADRTASNEFKARSHTRHRFGPSKLLTTFPVDTGASAAWSTRAGRAETGFGISVAVIDSGLDASHPDLSGNVVAVNVNRTSQTALDGYGHGTHVAGIINGHDVDDQYLGVAPEATVISVKVADDKGGAYVSDLLRGLDWVAAHRDDYQIRALNISASVSFPESYATSPVDAAVEYLWHDGVAVVTSAGNLGAVQDAVWYAPGNDPQVITVGCLDENQTATSADDSLCPISSRGLTEDGFAKPDLVAPGRKIVSTLASGINGQGASLAAEFPLRISADGQHISLSGTSMAAPMVAGAIALLLDRHHDLTPDQLKQLLTATTRPYPGQADRAGALNITAALAASDTARADSKQVPLAVGAAAPSRDASTILWDGARWTTTYWDGARWTSAYWDGARWTSAYWDGARWTATAWDGARWTAGMWDGARWTATAWDGARWTATAWDGARWTTTSLYD
jgi:serine protease AprX